MYYPKDLIFKRYYKNRFRKIQLIIVSILHYIIVYLIDFFGKYLYNVSIFTYPVDLREKAGTNFLLDKIIHRI